MRAIRRCLGIGSALGLLLLGGSATAQTVPSQALKDWFQRFDKNNDGKLDRAEFQEGVVEAFYLRDKSKSGYLTIEELQGASPEAIKAASRSHDNRLTLDEYVNALFKDFAAADTDGDGKLTFEEIDVYIRTNRR
jgi:Ca2+-binding EF-hand superfamily protein